MSTSYKHLFDNTISSIKESKLSSDSFWAILGSLVKQGLSLATGILIARILGRDSYGEYGTIKTTLVYITIVSTLGLGYTATKYVVENTSKERRTLLPSLIIFFLNTSFITSIILAIIVFVFSDHIATFLEIPHLSKAIRYSSPIIIFNAINATQIAILSGFRAFRSIAKNSTATGIVTFVSGVALTYQYGVEGAISALGISFFFHSLLNTISIKNEKKNLGAVKNSKNDVNKREILFYSLPIALQESLYAVANWGTLFILIKYGNYGEVGLYSAAAIWESVVIYIPGVLKNVMFAHLVDTSKEKHKKTVKHLLRIHLTTTLIPVAFVLLFSYFIANLYGSTFLGFLPVLIVRVSSAIFISLSEVYCYEFISRNKTWTIFLLRFIRDVGTTVLGLVIILWLGTKEALIMALACFIFRLVFLLFLRTLYRRSSI